MKMKSLMKSKTNNIRKKKSKIYNEKIYNLNNNYFIRIYSI